MKRDALVGSNSLGDESDEEELGLRLDGRKNPVSEDSIPITPEIVEEAKEFLEQPVCSYSNDF
jgi:hypothetical protein